MKYLLPILCLCLPIQAQDTVYGTPAELKGLSRVYVDAGTDVKNRERVIEELKKSKIGFQILDSSDGAEIVLHFAGDKERRLTQVRTNRGTSRPTYENVNTGAGTVFVVRENVRRVVMSFDDEEETLFEKKPATNFAKTFVKAYRKANGLK